MHLHYITFRSIADATAEPLKLLVTSPKALPSKIVSIAPSSSQVRLKITFTIPSSSQVDLADSSDQWPPESEQRESTDVKHLLCFVRPYVMAFDEFPAQFA